MTIAEPRHGAFAGVANQAEVSRMSEQHPASSRRRWVRRWLWLLPLALLLPAELYTLHHARRHRVDPAAVALGNTQAVIDRLPAPAADEPFAFAVLGDIDSGAATFDRLLRKVKTQNVQFIVQLGDCVGETSPDRERFFRAEFAEHEIAVPTFVIAGNHDIAPGLCPVEQFEAVQGPADFCFVYRDCLFVGLGRLIDESRAADSLAFLERALREHGATARRRFVFLHYPLPVRADFPGEPFPLGPEFVKLIRQHRVDYVIAGHYHTYARLQVGPTTFLISGGGGGRLRPRYASRTGFTGLFHHALVIRVDRDAVAELIMPCAPAGPLAKVCEKPEFLATMRLYPWLRRHPLAAVTINLAAVALAAPAFRRRRCCADPKPAGRG